MTSYSYANRRVISTAIGLLIAWLIAKHFALMNAEWILIATFLTCLGTRGTPLKHGMLTLVILIAALFFSALLITYIVPTTNLIIISIFMIIAGYLAAFYYPLPRTKFILLLYFPIIVLLAILEPNQVPIIKDQRILASLYGVLIGIITTIIFIPMSLEKEFRLGLVPVISALASYSKTLRIYIGTKEFNRSLVEKTFLEQTLQAYRGAYPEWVFEVGFNPGLRSGYRFFLVTLDQVIETLFSLSLHFSQKINPDLIEKSHEALNESLKINTQLFTVLLSYFHKKELRPLTTDFTSDLQHLEAVLKTMLPPSLELLDLSPDYQTLTAIVRDIKDARQLLLQLISALPST